MKKHGINEIYYYYFVSLFGLLLAIYLSVEAFNETDLIKRAWFLVFQVLVGVLLCALPFLVERLLKIKASSFLRKLIGSLFYFQFF